MDQRAQPLPVRAFRSDDVVTVAAPMPGLIPEDISVEVTETGDLILDGRVRTETNEAFGHLKSSKQVLLDEWSAGPYHRDVPLSVAVDGPAATVTYGNGVLVVALPVARQTRPARLRLQATGSARGERLPR